MAASDARGDTHGEDEGEKALRRVVEAAWLSSDCRDSLGGAEIRVERAIPALPAVGVARLARLVALWRHYGRAMNLVGQHGALDSVERQLGEALLVVRLGYRLGAELRDDGAGDGIGGVRPREPFARPTWLDVGSGAGFPALVVAALLDVEVTLIEPRAKRAAFLELGLGSVAGCGQVVPSRLEGFEAGVGRDRRGSFTFASARAVFSPTEWLRRGEPWVAPGGWIIVEAHRESSEPLGWGTERRLDAGPWSARGFQRPFG